MKLIVGLGNPGEEYRQNRHNIGYQVVERLTGEGEWEKKFESLVLKQGETVLVKPVTFMNRSGRAVSEIVNFYKVDLDNLWVVHDDLDIPLGEYKIQKGVGPRVHKGVNSIEESLGRSEFWRVRVGVDNRPSGEGRTPGEEYVLQDFSVEEKNFLSGIIEEVVKELRLKINEA